jgi:PPOX class probable F420-dependent enzyme
LDAPNYVHLATLRAHGSPRNHVVWVGLEGDNVLVCTSDLTWKAKDMRRDPRVALSVADLANPYRMAMLQGRVIEERPDEAAATWTRSASSTRARPSPAEAPTACAS